MLFDDHVSFYGLSNKLNWIEIEKQGYGSTLVAVVTASK